MSNLSASAAEMLLQLESARKLALGDAQVYTQVIPGILPIIGPSAPLEVRRWGADFLSEGFASPLLQTSVKEQLVADVLPTLKTMLDNPNEDAVVLRCAVQTSASIYPLVFSRVISHPDQALIWHDMTSMKLSILGCMDSAPTPVKVCCIKFLQKVVQVQTPGVIADPRRPERNETSIALVPRGHPLLPLQNLEAEASGLLDRLLSTLQEQSSDPILVDATVNCLAVLLRTRPPVANKILATVLNYNPFKMATTAMIPRQVVIVKSLERTVRTLLRYVLRTLVNNPMHHKIRAYLERLEQTRVALFSETSSLKRPAENIDVLDDVKRQRLTQPLRRFPPMPPPPNSYAQLFTLTEDAVLQQFDVKLLPQDMVANISGLLLQHIDSKGLDESVEAIRKRYEHLQKVSRPTPVPDIPMAGPTGIDDDDDYDPEGFASTSPDMLSTGTSISAATEKALEELAQPAIELGPFELPKPPPLSVAEIAVLSESTYNGVFDIAKRLEVNPTTHGPLQKSGLNRLAASSNDSLAWVTLLGRIATRGSSGLDKLVLQELKEETKSEEDGSSSDESGADDSIEAEQPTMSNQIRHALFGYILEDWRARLNVAIGWLTEEWYADRTAWTFGSHNKKKDDGQSRRSADTGRSLPNYTRALSRLLTHLIPRFDESDSKLLIRFLSEIPHLSLPILDQIKQLAFDPVTMKICVLALHYLVMFRPPIRDMVLDTLESVWTQADDDKSGVRIEVGKVLKKWRPGALQAGATQKQVQVPKVKTEPQADTGVGAGTGAKTKAEPEAEAAAVAEVEGDSRMDGDSLAVQSDQVTTGVGDTVGGGGDHVMPLNGMLNGTATAITTVGSP